MQSLCTHNNNTPQFNIYLLSWTIFVRVFIVYTTHITTACFWDTLCGTQQHSVLSDSVRSFPPVGVYFFSSFRCFDVSIFLPFIVLHMCKDFYDSSFYYLTKKNEYFFSGYGGCFRVFSKCSVSLFLLFFRKFSYKFFF